MLLSGSIDRVPDEEVAVLAESLSLPWQPDLLRAAAASEETRLYRFAIDDRQGIRHAGLPEGFDAGAGDDGE